MSIEVIARAGAGPFAAACVLLGLAGASKIRRPGATRAAVAALGLPASSTAVRFLGAIEAVVAGAGLAFGGAAAGAVAILYGALAVAAWRLLARSPGTACGCLGTSDAPVTAAHLVINVSAMVAAALATAAGAPLAAVSSDLWARLAFVLLAGCAAWLAASLLDTLPALNSAVHEGGSR